MFRIWKRTPENQIELTISNVTIIRVLALVLVSVIFLAALHRATYALILIFTSFFLTVALNAPVHWIGQRLPGKRRGNRVLGTAVSFLLVVAFLGTFFVSVVPPVARQTNTFLNAVPQLIADVHNQDSSLGQFVRKYHLEAQVNTFSNQLSERLKNASGSAVSTVTKIGSSIFSTLTILAMTFMMLIEGPRWLDVFFRLLPDDRQKYGKKLGADMYHVIRGYVNGQVLLAAIAAMLITPMLFILHLNYPIALMLVIFICGLIPLVGHFIGGAIITTVALFHSPTAAIIILCYYILYQQIETYVVQPRVQANSTELSPLLVFVAVVIGVNFGGLFGGLVAIPVMACLRVFILDQVRSRHMLSSKDEAIA